MEKVIDGVSLWCCMHRKFGEVVASVKPTGAPRCRVSVGGRTASGCRAMARVSVAPYFQLKTGTELKGHIPETVN